MGRPLRRSFECSDTIGRKCTCRGCIFSLASTSSQPKQIIRVPSTALRCWHSVRNPVLFFWRAVDFDWVLLLCNHQIVCVCMSWRISSLTYANCAQTCVDRKCITPEIGNSTFLFALLYTYHAAKFVGKKVEQF